jgi:hypothetical protein
MKRFLLLAVCLGLAGCATIPQSLTVSINSINNNESLSKKTCVVVSGLKEVPTADLQFQEYATYVKRALAIKGYVLSDDMETADIVVFLGYGISDPTEHHYSYAVPIFGQTGVSSANTIGNTYSFGSSATMTSTTTYNPTYGVTGAVPQTGSYVTYTRQVSLIAYDMKSYRETKKEKQLWKTEIVSTGNSGDLRRVFPVLIGGASQYVGENTGKQVNVELQENSKKVLEIKGINIVEDVSKATKDKK